MCNASKKHTVRTCVEMLSETEHTITHILLWLILCLSRCELQISQSPGHSCNPRSPPLPVHHPPPAGRTHWHDAHLHHLLPVCCSASGRNFSFLWSFFPLPSAILIRDITNDHHCPSGDFALPGQPDGALAVAKGAGPWQLLYPLPHSSGWPACDRLQLILLVSSIQKGVWYRHMILCNVLFSICKWLKSSLNFRRKQRIKVFFIRYVWCYI